MAAKPGLRIPELYPMAKLGSYPFQGLKGKFEGQKRGVTIHYTADRDLDRVIEALNNQGLNYHLIIDRDGSVTQTASMYHKVYHAGKAEWNGMSPNQSHIAIALVNWGYLEPGLKSWTGVPIPPEETAHRQGYYWDACTHEQEEKLYQVLRWLVFYGVDPADICGHDECCIPPGRKVDPGGCLKDSVALIRKALGKPVEPV